MQTRTVELIHEKAIDLLENLAALNVIRFVEKPEPPRKGVRLGSLEGQYSIPDDFNASLGNLEDYR